MKFDGMISLVRLWHFSNFLTTEILFSTVLVFDMPSILMKVRFHCIHLHSLLAELFSFLFKVVS